MAPRAGAAAEVTVRTDEVEDTPADSGFAYKAGRILCESRGSEE